MLGTADQVVEDLENGVLPDAGLVHQVALDVLLVLFKYEVHIYVDEHSLIGSYVNKMYIGGVQVGTRDTNELPWAR